MFIFYNSNPNGIFVGDCVIRAISKLTDKSWEDIYLALSIQGFIMKDMPSSNHVWGAYLKSMGYSQRLLPDNCPDCYTVVDFCNDFPVGKYMLATGSHVIAVENGSYYDSWDSGSETPVYYWKKENSINGD